MEDKFKVGVGEVVYLNKKTKYTVSTPKGDINVFTFWDSTPSGIRDNQVICANRQDELLHSSLTKAEKEIFNNLVTVLE